jgi:nucleotide-binding universal stress UspA family protein
MTAPGRVVLGVSHSLAGLAALRHALAEARHRAVPLHAVRAYPHPPTTRSTSYLSWQLHLEDTTRAYVHEAFDAALGALPADVDIVVSTSAGSTTGALMDAVSGSGDLLVLGAPASRWRHSRTVRGCTRAAECPVIVVPAPDLAREWRRLPLRRIVSAFVRDEHHG